MYCKHRKRPWQYLCIIALVFAMLFSIAGQTLAEAFSDSHGIQVRKLDNVPNRPETGKKPVKELEEDELYDPHKKVIAIIELEGNPLADEPDAMDSSSKGVEFTPKGMNLRSSIISEQQEIIQRISEEVLNGEELSIRGSYTVLLNGFSVEIEHSQLKEIRNVSGVKAAYVAPIYEIEPNTVSAAEMMGVIDLWNTSGYRGQGMRIAIIDSGIDVDHELFRDAPEDPSMDLEKMRDVIANVNLHAKQMAPGVTAEDVYLSDKIPYAFDYAEGVANADHRGGSSHGTHVAGIAAGNDGVNPNVTGMAPEAQLYIMKTMNAGGQLEFDAVLTALEDCVLLNVDVVNMSLGGPAGFSDEYGITSIDGVYTRLGKTGIFISASAGNSYNSGYRNRWGKDFPLVSDPDNGIVGMPSSFKESTSVASIDNKTFLSDYFDANGENIPYMDGTPPSSPLNFQSLLDIPLIYVPVPNGGAAEDYEGLNLDDWSDAPKVALVQRGGGLSFQEKHDNAIEAGAYAMVVYNNEASWIVMQFQEQRIPAVLINQLDGELMIEQENKRMMVKEGQIAAPHPFAGHPSDFSSWGPLSDLKLKPEIAAPGGNIYSSVDGNRYATDSGTSMAAPCIAGVAALVKQYIKDDARFANVADDQMRELINTLIMCTAVPATYEDDFFGLLPFSPRKQGSGLASVNNAIHTNAYITVPNMVRPKIELGDDPNKTGVYELTFNVHNFGEETLTYLIDPSVMTEFVDYDESFKAYMAGTPNPLEPEIETNWADNTVVVPAGETKQVDVKLTLSQGDRMLLDNLYENGMYVEGYVTLKSLNEDAINLSLPFLGFYGDWTQAPQIDHGFYWEAIEDDSGSKASILTNEAFVAVNDLFLYYLGDNMDHLVPHHQDRNAISPNGDKKFDSLDYIYTSLLRNADELKYTITGEDGTEYYSYGLNNISKTYVDPGMGRAFPVGARGYDGIAPWYGTDEQGNALPNNSKATVHVEATLDFDAHASNNRRSYWEFPITIDIEAPEMLSYVAVEEDGKTYLRIELTDNQYVADVSTFAYVNGMVDYNIESMPGEAREPGQTLTYDLDVTNHNKVLLVVTDYAFNETAYEIDIPKDGFFVEPSTLSMYVEEQYKLTAALYTPHTGNENILDEPVAWTSSDETIADVDDDGLVLAINPGNVVITAETPSGLSATCSLTVKDIADAPTLIFNKEVYFGEYEQNNNLEDGVEPIQWRVLKNEDGKLLLLSERAIEMHAFVDWNGEMYVESTWAESDVRRWMNGEFYENMFSVAERDGVSTTLVKAVLNGDYPHVEQGEDTEDRIFLLSYDDVLNTEYGFVSSPQPSFTRVTTLTPSMQQICIDDQVPPNTFWMLRTMGYTNMHAIHITPDGGVASPGALNITANTAIRPAFNLDLSMVAFTSDASGKPQNIGELSNMSIPDGAVKLSMYNDGQTIRVTNEMGAVSADKTLSVNYEGATLGENQYVSVTITGTNGNIIYYGKMADCSAGSGSGSFEVPVDMLRNGTYTLNVFSEQDNGASRTDFVSQMQSFTFVISDEPDPTPSYKIEVGSVNAERGNRVNVPVSLYNLAGGVFTVEYDADALTYITHTNAEDGTFIAINDRIPGMLEIAVVNPYANYNGESMGLEFRVADDAQDTYELALDIREGSAIIDGVSESVPVDDIGAIGGSITVLEGYTVTFNYMADGEWTSQSQTVAAGESAIAPQTLPQVHELTQYIMTGWDADFTSVHSDLLVTAQYGLLGDTYTDGKLTVTDTLLIMRGIIGEESLGELQMTLADVDGSGAVNINDALYLLRIIIGVESFRG